MSASDNDSDSGSLLGGARGARPLNGPVADGRTGVLGPPRRPRVADAGPQDKGKPKPKGGGKQKTREITIVGTFKNPHKSKADEIKAMKDKSWEPSTDDFVAVGGKTVTVDTYLQVLGAILVDGNSETPAGSIGRINIFTHANSDLIALSGQVTPTGSVFLTVDTALSEDTLDNLNKEGVTFTVASASKKIAKKKYSLADVQKRFAKDAVIVIYACHSAVDGKFLQTIADTFQVKVRGFKDLIGYFPKYTEDPVTIDRRRVGIGFNSKVIQSDFHQLDSSGTVKDPKQ